MVMGSDQSSWFHSCFDQIHGPPVISVDKGGWGENHSSCRALLVSINLCLDFSEAHLDCSCVYLDPRRALELTALFLWSRGRTGLGLPLCVSAYTPPPLVWWQGPCWREDILYVCSFPHPALKYELDSLSQHGRSGYGTNCWYLQLSNIVAKMDYLCKVTELQLSSWFPWVKQTVPEAISNCVRWCVLPQNQLQL